MASIPSEGEEEEDEAACFPTRGPLLLVLPHSQTKCQIEIREIMTAYLVIPRPTEPERRTSRCLRHDSPLFFLINESQVQYRQLLAVQSSGGGKRRLAASCKACWEMKSSPARRRKRSNRA